MTGMRVLVAGHVEYVIGRVTMDQIVISLDKNTLLIRGHIDWPRW